MMSFTTLGWRVAAFWHRLGIASMLAISLFCLVAGLEWVTIPRLEIQRAESQSALFASKSRLRQLNDHDAANLSKRHDDLSEFLEIISSAKDREAALREIGLLAKQENLQWQAAEYQVDRINDLSVERATLKCTLKGNYPAMRAYLHKLLAEMPGLAITSLSLETGTGALPATLELEISVYFRVEGSLPGGKRMEAAS